MKVQQGKEKVFVGSCAVPPTSNLKFIEKQGQIKAETDKLEYLVEPVPTPCKYLIGVVENGKITLVEAPMVKISTMVKREAFVTQVSKNMEARNALGQAFGTKKRKQAIKAQEQNSIDVEGLKESQSMISKEISMKSIPTKTEAVRLVPCNQQATTPQQVYPLSTLIPDDIYNSIDVSGAWKARALSEAKTCLASLKVTPWIWELMTNELRTKKEKEKFKQLFVAASLIRFQSISTNDLNHKDIGERCFAGNTPLAEHLVSIFAETHLHFGDTRFKLTPILKDKCLGYLLAVLLHLHDYSLDPHKVASDLSLSVAKVIKVGKELGARVSGKGPDRRLVLAIPLVFPSKRV